jgi:UDP:flavonoid glycosyltransferase YjiC (YdhE family)
VLASVIPGTGHLLPLLPSLHALRDAGDTVLVASAEPLRAEVEVAGLGFAAVGPSWQLSDADALLPGFQTASSARQLGMFAELAPAVVPDLLALADDVRPHVLLREPYEFAAWLAAERSGLPMVVHAIGAASGSTVMLAAIAGEPLAAARTATGLPADPDLKSLHGRGIITFYPSSLRFLQLPPPDLPQQPIRLPLPEPARLPFERARPGRPLVYVTLGTVFNNTALDLLRTLVSGVAALDVEVLVTTGQMVDPAMLGPQPAHVHAARFVPQQDVLAAVAAVVCHAGVGTVYGALSVGAPLVVAPLAADQPICAMGCVLAGAAVSLAPVPPPQAVLTYVTDPTSVTPTQVSEATTQVLETPTYRHAAQRIADEIAAAPRPPPSGRGSPRSWGVGEAASDACNLRC